MTTDLVLFTNFSNQGVKYFNALSSKTKNSFLPKEKILILAPKTQFFLNEKSFLQLSFFLYSSSFCFSTSGRFLYRSRLCYHFLSISFFGKIFYIFHELFYYHDIIFFTSYNDEKFKAWKKKKKKEDIIVKNRRNLTRLKRIYISLIVLKI